MSRSRQKQQVEVRQVGGEGLRGGSGGEGIGCIQGCLAFAALKGSRLWGASWRFQVVRGFGCNVQGLDNIVVTAFLPLQQPEG